MTDKVYDAFVGGFVAQMQDIKMGDPTDNNTHLGRLSSQDQFDTGMIRINSFGAADMNMSFGGSKIPGTDVNTVALE